MYVENSKSSTKKLLKLINKFRKVAGYQAGYKNQLHFYTNNEQSEKEIKRTIPLIIASKE